VLRACNLGSLFLLQCTSLINFFVGGARHEYPSCHHTCNLYMQSGIYYTCLFQPLQAQYIRKRPPVSLRYFHVFPCLIFSYYTFSLATYRLLSFTPVLHSPPLPFPCPLRHRLIFLLLLILLFSCSLSFPSPFLPFTSSSASYSSFYCSFALFVFSIFSPSFDFSSVFISSSSS
jgi:hypothetical protein